MPSLFANIADHMRWTLLYGPVLSVLPARWRVGRFGTRYAHWAMATIISGGLEAFAALNMLIAWFFLEGNHTVLLWLGAYMFADGGWRTFSASLNNEAPGTVALVLLDDLYLAATRGIWAQRHPQMADVVTPNDAWAEWQLKIESSRAKKDWEVGKMIFYKERYFRIETRIELKEARPFVYLLRALPTGVPSMRVITYAPDAPARASST
jgi:hypothetical protein